MMSFELEYDTQPVDALAEDHEDELVDIAYIPLWEPCYELQRSIIVF